MKRNLVLIKFFAIFILFVSTSAQAVPNLISYQGVLNDKDGVPMNTTVNMTFRLYDVETDGTVLWNETQSVQVANGLFDIKLGSVQQLSATFFHNDNLFLGIQVGADSEMLPRQRLTSGSYTYKAETVGHAGMPIGTIMAWAKNMTGIPALGSGWVECNGQVLSDSQSPLDGQTIPDLNGQNKFLRGNSVSGGEGGAGIHQHFSGLHERESHDTLFIGGYGKRNTTQDLSNYLDAIRSNGYDINVIENSIPPSYDWDSPGRDEYQTSVSDSRPPYFDVIWIMKIK